MSNILENIRHSRTKNETRCIDVWLELIDFSEPQ